MNQKWTHPLLHSLDYFSCLYESFANGLRGGDLVGYPAALMRIVSSTPQALNCWTVLWGSNLTNQHNQIKHLFQIKTKKKKIR